MSYLIQRAKASDSQRLRDFISTDWKADHYFVLNPSFFDYHYSALCGDLGGRDLNMYFATAPDGGGEVVGVLGFIPLAFVRGAHEETHGLENEIFLSLWKVRPSNDPSLGMRLLQFLMQDYEPVGLYCTGINKKTLGIYKFLRYQTGVMARHILLNPCVSEYQIVRVSDEVARRCHDLQCDVSQGPSELLQVSDFGLLRDQLMATGDDGMRPKKSWAYIRWRYLEHPVYDYRIWEVSGLCDRLFVVTRKLTLGTSKAFRIVDFLGNRQLLLDFAPSIGDTLRSWLRQGGGEYVELTQAGLSDDLLAKMGFYRVRTEDENVVMPAYFEPFAQENVDIFYFSALKERTCLFLGDGDQDRPNELSSGLFQWSTVWQGARPI